MAGASCADCDDREIYCRILGHYVCFSYCRCSQEGYPCSRVLDCWSGSINIRSYLEQHYTAEEMARFLQPPKPKMQTLMDLIWQAQDRMKGT